MGYHRWYGRSAGTRGKRVLRTAADRRALGVEGRIEDAVFVLMETTDIPSIRVSDVVRLSKTSRSTFYRHYRNVDEVVKLFEADLLDNMRSINRNALNNRFGRSELDPTPAMVERMEVLAANRQKILALNGQHGDPTFTHKATVLMHDHFRARLRGVTSDERQLDLYLSFVLAGHHNLVQYWLEKRPDLSPRVVAGLLNRLFYTPFFVGPSQGQGDGRT